MSITASSQDLVSEEDRSRVAALLGREPRGLETIQVRNSLGEPSVIRVSSLVDDKPFPTLFWLVDKQLSYELDKLEARGVIAELQQEIDAIEELQQQLKQDHEAYIRLREQFMSEEVKARLIQLGYYDDLIARGIGGIADFGRIRCLHTYYAAHLVQSNLVGRFLDENHL